MNKIIASLSGFFIIIFLTACNNADKKTEEPGGNAIDVPKTTVDSLMEGVMEGHDAGMAKYGKLQALQNKAQNLIDSLNQLPVITQKATTAFKTNLGIIVEDLKKAKESMDKWMDEFNMDSAENNIDQRIQYLKEEKMKVAKVKESILNSLQKADSIMKTKL